MPTYLGTPAARHRLPERLGVLLVNLGTPAAPTSRAVRRYLKQFLSDPRVIEYPRWLWWPILNGVILQVRPRRSAHAYRQIWTPQGSPLLVHTRALAEAIHARLRDELHAEVQLAVGMTYGEPSIAQALQQLHDANVRKLLVLPLFPQYSASTAGSVFDVLSRVLQRWRWLPELRFVSDYHDDDAYLAALANSVTAHWRTHGKKHLLLSFHGLPQAYERAGDPYARHCLTTARLLAAHLQLNDSEWTATFQSRVGVDEWLRPYTDDTLQRYARQGPKRITAVCPGFAVDCLETLEEIAMRNRDAFLAAGGEAFDYVPCLNATPDHVAALSGLIRRHTQDWPESLRQQGTA